MKISKIADAINMRLNNKCVFWWIQLQRIAERRSQLLGV